MKVEFRMRRTVEQNLSYPVGMDCAGLGAGVDLALDALDAETG